MAAKANGSISKMEGVRQALATLSDGAAPTEIQKFLKQQFGLAMTTGHISNYKSDILKKQRIAAKSAANGAPAKAKGKPGPKPGASKRNGVIGLDDIRAVKALAGKLGPANLKSLIDVLA